MMGVLTDCRLVPETFNLEPNCLQPVQNPRWRLFKVIFRQFRLISIDVGKWLL